MPLRADSNGQISFGMYERWARTFNVEEALPAIARLSRTLELERPIPKNSILNSPNNVGQWQLAFFAKTLIEKSNDYRAKPISDSALFYACAYYNNIRDPHLRDPVTEEARRELLNHLIRMSYEEFPMQVMNHRADIPRTMILFEELASAAGNSEFDVARAFREKSGLTVREFLLIGFAYWVHAGQGEIRPPISTTIPNLKGILSPENQSKFLSIVAADYSRFRTNQQRQLIKDGYEKHQFNCLHLYPLIWTTRKRLLVCPLPPLLIRRVTRGIYYYLQEAYSKGKDRNEFTSFFGKQLFEPYVGMQLRTLRSKTELRPESSITKSEKSCDWILIEGESTTLIECKTLGLTARAKSFGEPNIVLEDLRRRILKAVAAFQRTERAIDSGAPGFGDLRGKPRRNLIVLYDEIFLFNSLLYRELLQNDLEASGLDKIEFQVCSISELEYVIPALANHSLGAVLDEKVANSERRTWDLGIFVQHLVSEARISPPGPNTILNGKFEEVFAPFETPARR